MAWVSGLIAVGGMLLSNYESNKASGIAQGAVDNQGRALQSQLGLANTEQTQANSMYNRYWNTMVPLQNQYITAVESNMLDPTYQAGLATATAQQQGDLAQQTMMQRAAAYGINPASGKFASMLGNLNLQNAALRTGAANNARQFTNQQRLAALGGLTNLGQNTFGEANSAAAAGGSMFGSAANGYAGQISTFGNLAGEAGTGIGMGLADLGNAFANGSTNTPTYTSPSGNGGLSPDFGNSGNFTIGNSPNIGDTSSMGLSDVGMGGTGP